MKSTLARISVALFLIVLLPLPSYAEGGGCGNLFEERCSVVGRCSSTGIATTISRLLGLKPRVVVRMDRLNKSLLRDLNAREVPTPTGDRRGDLERADIQTLYDSVSKHPVADLANYAKYDPEKIGIGFCFGRAMTAHLEALWNHSLQNASIRKMWAVGKLVSGSTSWRYHVTTIVKGKDGGWWAIDPIFGRPIRAEDWYAKMKSKFDSDGQMALFETDGKRFGPNTEAAYKKEHLNADYLNSYFVDLLNAYKMQRLKSPEDYE